jgi:hypothetical protein
MEATSHIPSMVGPEEDGQAEKNMRVLRPPMRTPLKRSKKAMVLACAKY